MLFALLFAQRLIEAAYKAGYCRLWRPNKWPGCLMPGIWASNHLNECSMSDVLFIKISSLGDVIHHMPALTEARARRPDARFAWVVEEAFAPLVALHPAAAAVVPVGARRWRRAPWQASTWRDIQRFRRGLRTRAYDI